MEHAGSTSDEDRGTAAAEVAPAQGEDSARPRDGGTQPDTVAGETQAAPDEPAPQDGPAASEPVPQDGAADEDGRDRDQLLAALEEAETTADEYLADLRRVQAEFDNYRKRMMREGSSARQAGTAEVITRLLDVLDDFDLAVLSADRSDDVESLRKGLELVYGKLVDVLRSFGLRRIDDEGVPFDPERHEAVQRVDAEEPVDGPVVIDVLRPGYEVDGRVLRAAMVKVAQ